MLEYQKSILQKISFDRSLFTKELKKSLNWLSTEEIIKLHKWVTETFKEHRDIITEVFETRVAYSA